MFEISALKEKKISELQEIATKLGIKKITTLKKMDLAYKIIDHYAANPKVNEEKAPEKVEKELKTKIYGDNYENKLINDSQKEIEIRNYLVMIIQKFLLEIMNTRLF